MKVSVELKEDNYLEVIMVGEDHSLPNMLRDALMEDGDVEFAAYYINHPQLGSPKLQIRTNGKKKPQKALAEAVKKIRKRITEFQSALEKVKDEKKGRKEKKKK